MERAHCRSLKRSTEGGLEENAERHDRRALKTLFRESTCAHVLLEGGSGLRLSGPLRIPRRELPPASVFRLAGLDATSANAECSAMERLQQFPPVRVLELRTIAAPSVMRCGILTFCESLCAQGSSSSTKLERPVSCD